MGRPNKLHHTAPKSYLAAFAEPATLKGALWVLNGPDLRLYRSSPEKILTDSDFYTVRLPSGRGTLDIEKKFLAKIEGFYADLYRKKISMFKQLDEEEKAHLVFFMASMLFRVPAHREMWRRFFDQIKEHVEQLESLPDEQKAKLASIPTLESGDKSVPADEFLKAAEDLGSFHSAGLPGFVYDVAPTIYRMRCGFMVSPSNSVQFLTSDNPCIMLNPELEKRYRPGTFGSSPGLAQYDVELTLPLSAEIAVLWGWQLNQDGRYVKVSEDMVRQINARTIRGSKKIISRSKEQLEELQRRASVLRALPK